MNIVLLHNVHHSSQSSPEAKPCWDQVVAVESALVALGHSIRRHFFGLDMDAVKVFLEEQKPDLVFNLVERINNSSRLAHICPAIIESLHIPYTGCGVYSLFATGSQLRTKELLGLIEAPTPRWHTEDSLAMEQETISGRYILKPVYEHGLESIDDWSVVSVSSRSQLQERLLDRHAQARSLYFAEEYIDGREFSLFLLGDHNNVKILPVMEIISDSMTHAQRIQSRKGTNPSAMDENGASVRYRFDFTTADIALLRRLRHLARSCWALFEMNGYARIDFRISEDGKPYVIDVTPNPTLIPDAGMVASSACEGLDPRALVDQIMTCTTGDLS